MLFHWTLGSELENLLPFSPGSSNGWIWTLEPKINGWLFDQGPVSTTMRGSSSETLCHFWAMRGKRTYLDGRCHLTFLINNNFSSKIKLFKIRKFSMKKKSKIFFFGIGCWKILASNRFWIDRKKKNLILNQ